MRRRPFAAVYKAGAEIGASVAAIGGIAHATRYLIEFHAMPRVEVGPFYWPAMRIGLAALLLSVFSPEGIRESVLHATHYSRSNCDADVFAGDGDGDCSRG